LAVKAFEGWANDPLLTAGKKKKERKRVASMVVVRIGRRRGKNART
jgi:hypothetical protein